MVLQKPKRAGLFLITVKLARTLIRSSSPLATNSQISLINQFKHKNMNYLKDAAIIIAFFLLLALQLRCCKKKPNTIVEKEIVVEVNTPEYIRVSDTLYQNSIVYRRIVMPSEDDSLLIQYLKDSLNRLNMFLNAIAIREYNQSFTDSLQQINVYSKTKGELIEQAIDYKIFPRTYRLDTTIQFNCENISKHFVSVGAGYNSFSNTPSLHIGYNYLTKKQKLLNAALSSDGQIYFKYGFLIRQPQYSN